MIHVSNLKKKFTSYKRGHGFVQAVKSLIVRKKKIFHAINNISFDISKGEIVGFLGPNGAGKSTTIKALCGILYPDSGEITVLGYVPYKDRKRYVANIGVVFGQKSQLMWDLPAIDAFYLHKSIYKIPKKEFEKSLKSLVKLMEIKEIIRQPTRSLSLGQRMRCEFVMAMLHRPKIVFLDEPTIGLDLFGKEAVRKFIKEINAKFGTTVIITSHDLDDIEHICDRVIIINSGKIVYDDKIKNLSVSKIKIVKVRTINKAHAVKGIKIRERPSPYDIVFEIDTDKISVSSLLKKIGAIEDLEVSSPPIAEVVKEFY